MVAVNVKYFYRVMRARTYLSAHYPDLSEYSIPAGAIFLSTESAARTRTGKLIRLSAAAGQAQSLGIGCLLTSEKLSKSN